ncbi:DUF6380 family protein [Streptomyces sp. NPDC057474]
MDDPAEGEPIGKKWYATLRNMRASLTATAARGPIQLLGGPAGEGAR